MAGHGGVGGVRRGVLGLVAVLAVAWPLAAQEPGRLPIEAGRSVTDPMCSDLMRADARLADVSFVDPEHGWAVGDRGTIWHTADGGQSWQLQPSGVACRLESVSFVDRETGWAAGGFSHPYTHTSTGVALITHDGGRQWTRDPRLLLPAVKQIRFVSRRQGWAIGCPSGMFPSGVFFTDDGGRSWNPLPSRKTAGWVAGDFLASRDGVLADRSGMTATARRGSVEPAATPRFGLRGVARMKLVPEVEPQVYGWLVGQGGLVMLTSDLGTNWQTPEGELPEGIAEQFDFAALAVRGPRVWVAGSPGTRVLHSPDAGRSWTAFATGQSLPIRALSFVDDQHGWAVGELGTILATEDGGQTWRRVRSGGTRAALLGIFSEPNDVPLELFAQLSGNEGYLGVVETLNRRDVEVAPRQDVHPADRLHEALVGVGASGGSAAWRFPMRQAGLGLSGEQIVEGWDQANDARGLDRMKAHVVRQIRTWRPEVVVTHDASPTGDDPRLQLVHQVVVEAVRESGDPTSYSEQITGAGLEPWQVKKVYAALQPGLDGAVSLATAELAERLGRSLADVVSLPRGLVEDRFRVSPSTLSFRLAIDNLERQPNRSDFFAGIVLYPGGEARRELLEPAVERVDLIRRIAQKRRNMQAILERTDKDAQGGLGLLAQTGDMTRGLDPDSSAQLLHHLAQRYYTTGQWPMAAEAFKRLVERHPEHPLAGPASVWLVQYYASGEAAWRVQGGQRLAVEHAAASSRGAPMPLAPGVGDPRFAVQQASAPAVDFSREEDRLELAAALGKQIAQTRPAVLAEPNVGFPLAVADRRRGFPAQADRFYLVGSRSTTRDAWWACARGEQWLADPKGVAPKPILSCVKTTAKPYLDGRLDDAVWAQAKPAELHSPLKDDADWPAKVKLAHDGEFLYLAIEAREAPGVKYRRDQRARPRDPDLSSQDRVDLFLDLDRDFATYYRLSIDHRGWPGEACWGDSTWDPTWFVAAEAEEGTWTAEAAIPLDQLTGGYPAARSVWAIGVQRVVPGVGLQSWTTPAAVDIVPEGFGYLIFE
ncbi:MAG TPA: YCF48-related protein [Thermoguttaceae bacterium]|nr:YCF48-related protein [Thermoguttaceae bacterium]